MKPGERPDTFLNGSLLEPVEPSGVHLANSSEEPAVPAALGTTCTHYSRRESVNRLDEGQGRTVRITDQPEADEGETRICDPEKMTVKRGRPSGSSRRNNKLQNLKKVHNNQANGGPAQVITYSQELMPPPCIPVDYNGQAVATEIVSECAMTYNDIRVLSGPGAFLCNATLGAYLSYVCTIDPSVRAIAIKPAFSGNRYLDIVNESELKAENFLVNPLGVDLSLVEYVFIPVLLLDCSIRYTFDQLQNTVGHWVLGVYNVAGQHLTYFDPYGNPLTDNAGKQLKHAVSTMPQQICHDNIRIIQRQRRFYNAQEACDNVNCGYYVCLFAETNLVRGFMANILVENFSIDTYKRRVITVLTGISNNRLPVYEQLGLADQVQLATRQMNDIEMHDVSVDDVHANTVPPVLAKVPPVTKMLKTPSLCAKNHPGRHCAGRSVNHKADYFHCGSFTFKCSFCNAFLLKSESVGQASKCCHGGKVSLMDEFNELQKVPAQLSALCDTRHPLSHEFLKDCRRYNTELAFGSVHTVSEKAPARGIPVCRLNGETSYELSDLYAPDGKKPIFGQQYALEPRLGLDQRLASAEDKKLNSTILQMLDQMIRENNALAKVYYWANELHQQKVLECRASGEPMPEFRLIILTNREAREYGVVDGTVHTHRTDLPTANQVALVWISKDGEPPDVSGITLRGRQGGTTTIPFFNPNVEPACFPLLRPYGTQGYRFGIPRSQVSGRPARKRCKTNLLYDDGAPSTTSDDRSSSEEESVAEPGDIPECSKRKYVSAREYYRFLMQMRSSASVDSCKAFHWLWNKRSLAEIFVITNSNGIEKREMQFSKDNQENLRHVVPEALIRGIEKGLAKGETLGKLYFAPVTWKGSRRYMQQAYADAKAITRHLGNPTWFLTFTGNPQWPEITDSLLEGQNYTHRPDIVVRVFWAKVSELLVDIVDRQVLGKTIGVVYSVEHQKRGMPHIHMLIILAPDVDKQSAEFIDEYISAEIPDLPDDGDTSDNAKQQRRLHKLVTKLNLHDCNLACQVDGQCSKHFPKQFSGTTVCNGDDFPMYTRRQPPAEGEKKSDEHGNTYLKPLGRTKTTVLIDNRRVVPYNPMLMLKYETHLNLEYIGSQQCTDYTFKYIMKGHDQAYVRLSKGNVVDYDEIAHAFKVRFMTSPEAYWRIMGYPIVYKSHIVIRQWVYAPGGCPIIVQEGYEQEAGQDALAKSRKNMLEAFFKLCSENEFARTLTYNQVGCYFCFNRQQCKWTRRIRDDPEKIIVRVGSVSPVNRQLFCIRILLFNVKGPTSFDDLKTVNSEVCETFEEACNLLNLLDSDDLWRRTLVDAYNERMGVRSFRRFFALLVFHCAPSSPNALFDEMLDMMVHPRRNMMEDRRRQLALNYLEYYFREWNTTCEMMGLPKPIAFNYESVEKLINDCDTNSHNTADDAERPLTFLDWSKVANQNKAKLNVEQRRVFDDIIFSVEADSSNKNRLFFVQGAGGTGKTFLYNTIIAYILGCKKSVVACASTGIAALLLIGGATIHSQFMICNDVDETSKSAMQFESAQANKLRNAAIIIMDEISMLHRHAFELVDKVLASIQLRDKAPAPFGGKVVLIGGDFKQLLPVIKKGGQYDQVLYSIKNSPLFKMFLKCELKQNMRVDAREVDFTQFLHNVGNGLNFIGGSDRIIIPAGNFVNDINELINFCFPSDFLKSPLKFASDICQCAILAPTNFTVEGINDTILRLLPGDTTTILSMDSLTVNGLEDHAVAGLQVHVGNNTLENVHRMTPTGFPPHRLNLRVGAIVMLIRNLSIPDGLCNGTRLQIVRIDQNLLLCKRITGRIGDDSNTLIAIPKIKFMHGTSRNDRETPFTRVQFPIRLSFAMTINKAQGQTLGRLGLALHTQEVFSHGQLYVALSRVRRFDSVRILAMTSKLKQQVRNVVLLDALG